jgi:hypothetical protein
MNCCKHIFLAVFALLNVLNTFGQKSVLEGIVMNEKNEFLQQISNQ